MWKHYALSTRRMPYSRGLLRDCEIFANLRFPLYSLSYVCVSSTASVMRSSGVSRLQYAIPRTCRLPTGIGTGEYIFNCSKYFLFNKIFFDKDLDQSGFWCHQNIFLPLKYFFYKSTWNISVCSNNYFGTQTSSGGAPGENTASQFSCSEDVAEQSSSSSSLVISDH